MQFKIPQDIRIEDKIFAFISIKQLFILLGGGGVAYVVFLVTQPIYPPEIYLIPVGLIVLITVGIAFFKMDNLNFIKVVLLFLESIINPQRRIWRHMPNTPNNFDRLKTHLDIELGGQKEEKKKKNIGGENVENLLQSVDTEDILSKIEKDDPTKPKLPPNL